MAALLRRALTLALALAPFGPARAAGADGAPAPATAPQLYCRNIAPAAADARFAWQARQLKDLEAELDQRVRDLDARIAAFKDAADRHDAILKRAADALLGIYAKMKPDAAAAQLSQLDDDMAAAVLAQLNPRQSSAILNEIAPDRAAHLVNAIANPLSPDGKKS